jgi:hypothetical protein
MIGRTSSQQGKINKRRDNRNSLQTEGAQLQGLSQIQGQGKEESL